MFARCQTWCRSLRARKDSGAILKVRRMREDIYRRFGEVNAQSDAVPFETGPLRPGDMAARDRIRRWQASLRSFYLLEAPLLQFRLFGNAASKSPSFTAFEDDFRYECSRIFLQIAESSRESKRKPHSHGSAEPPALPIVLRRFHSETMQSSPSASRALARLVRFIAQLVDRLQLEVASEGLYDVMPSPEPAQAGYENA